MKRLLWALVSLLSLSACYDDGHVPTYTYTRPVYTRPAPNYVPRTYYIARPVYRPVYVAPVVYRPVYVPRTVHMPRYRHR
jgi:hypothetical protein